MVGQWSWGGGGGGGAVYFMAAENIKFVIENK